MARKDPEKEREYQREWRAKNKESIRQRQRDAEARNKKFVLEYKEQHPCSCGESDPVCLEFHHRDPTTKRFSISLHGGRILTTLEAEMTKCDVLCSNCHKKLHARN